jgi:2-polyprenyl-6-hydroxyphenyl methylase/3-demethylubiquinone-9 3-methyltransferase
MNVDQAELRKFSDLAARWWDPEGPMRPLHEINPVRLQWIDGIAPLAGRQAVDIGCGGGVLAEAMAQRGAAVTGIDLAGKPLRVAQLHGLESGAQVEYRESSAESFAAEHPAAFDVVTCMEMLEHVPDPESVVRACATLAKPGGAVFFSTINRNLKSFLLAIVAAEYVLGLVPKGTHEYLKLVRPAELGAACRSAGLDLKELTGLHFNPLLDRYSLGGNVDVNYFAYTRKRGDS